MSFVRVVVMYGALTLMLGACNSTNIRSTWVASEANNTPLTKIAVFVLSENKEKTRNVETVIAQRIGPRVHPGHALLQPGEEGNKDKIKARLHELGFDGAITVRLLELENKESYIPPMVVSQPMPTPAIGYVPGQGFYNYYGLAYQQPVVLPGHTVRYMEAVVESIAYSLKLDAPVWSGITETPRPDSAMDAADQIAEVIRDALTREGVIRP